ncbi:MAG TPA: ribosome biogenesis GTPase Der [bacterium]|nr:ribosome biogenesis GTPase Der [bacterium]
MNAGSPIVAIVGRPNVGKSSLFNRFLHRRLAIVEAVPGLTRDRLEAPCEWRGRTFTLVDTGGLVLGRTQGLPAAVRRQTERAIADAALVVFVVDVTAGVMPQDTEIAEVLRRQPRPVLLVANKADTPVAAANAAEFHTLGLGDPMPVSAAHGLSTGELLDAIVAALFGTPASGASRSRAAGAARDTGTVEELEEVEEGQAPVRIAVIGRPNVGKSSLVNAVLGEERVVVHEEPGTTRDAVDTAFTYGGRAAVLIDTAGLRRRSRVAEPVEFYSTTRTRQALARADVAVLVVDATEGITDQDQRIAREAYDGGVGIVVAVNKWDLLRGYSAAQVERVARGRLRFLGAVHVRPTSAVRREGIDGLMSAVFHTAEARAGRIPTGPLNRVVNEAVAAAAPAADSRGHRLHIYYATQPESAPPTVVLFVNDPRLMTPDYQRYLEHRLRDKFDLAGTPIRWALRGRRPPETARTSPER